MSERVAIVGTAPSWTMTPWTDPSLKIYSLNDAYRMNGFVRADRWYDFHPLDKFVYSDGRAIYAHQVPPGCYVRPQGHLEWIASRDIPIYLHPDYLTQHPDAPTWTHARPFPKAAIEEHFGRYFTSSPAWMIAQAVMEGVKELHIYGIHLSTEFEYVKQRPNFEFLCGMVLGRGKRAMTVKHGLRHYESPDGVVILPEASPVLQESFQYAFDPRPDAHLEPLKWELHKANVKRQRVQHALIQSPWLTRTIAVDEPGAEGQSTRVKKTRAAWRDELYRLDALAADWQDQLGRAQMTGA